MALRCEDDGVVELTVFPLQFNVVHTLPERCQESDSAGLLVIIPLYFVQASSSFSGINLQNTSVNVVIPSI